MIIVVDTSALIAALHGKQATLRKILVLEVTGETLCTTQINVLELYEGAYSPARPETGLKKVKKLLETIACISSTHICERRLKPPPLKPEMGL